MNQVRNYSFALFLCMCGSGDLRRYLSVDAFYYCCKYSRRSLHPIPSVVELCSALQSELYNLIAPLLDKSVHVFCFPSNLTSPTVHVLCLLPLHVK